MNITDVAIELNAARLTLRNSNVLLRDSTDSSLGSSSSSTLPYVPMVVTGTSNPGSIQKMIKLFQTAQKIDSFEEGHLFIIIAPFRNFVPSTFLKTMLQHTQWVRHVSFYFVTTDLCYQYALALQPSMIRTNKHDGLKSFSINMHWIMSNQITMNTVYNYDFVVTLEDDVSKFKECSE